MKYAYKVQYTNYKGQVTVSTFICETVEELKVLCFAKFGTQYATHCKLISASEFSKKI